MSQVEASQLSVNAFDAARDASERTRTRELARKQRLGQFRRSTLARVKKKVPNKHHEDAWGSLHSSGEGSLSSEGEELASTAEDDEIPVPRPATPRPIARDVVGAANTKDDVDHRGSPVDTGDLVALSVPDGETASPRQSLERDIFVADDEMFLHRVSKHDADNEASRKAAYRKLLAAVSSTSHDRSTIEYPM